jgi:hypothetical protein
MVRKKGIAFRAPLHLSRTPSPPQSPENIIPLRTIHPSSSQPPNLTQTPPHLKTKKNQQKTSRNQNLLLLQLVGHNDLCLELEPNKFKIQKKKL